MCMNLYVNIQIVCQLLITLSGYPDGKPPINENIEKSVVVKNDLNSSVPIYGEADLHPDVKSFNCPDPKHPDYDALIDFYNATNGDSWTNRNGWIEALAGTSCDPCADGWFGVDCKGTNRVLELIMPNNNLSGQLPSTINDFTVLTNITLQNNSIGGSIPDALTLMTTLRTITLDNNNFTGSIPSNIGNLDNCTDFNIRENNISGPIPTSYGDMASLRSSTMRDNQLSGELPAEMANLSNLDAINIRNNQFTGCFPPGFAVFCSQLSFYDFSGNTGLNPNNGDFAQFCADPSIDYCFSCPTINPPSGGDQAYCTADGVPPLTVSIDPGLNARWYDAPSGGNELACCSTSYTPGGAGTYYVEAYDGNGCTSSRTAITLTLNPDPTYFNEVLSCEDANFYQVAFDTDASTITPDVGNLSGCCGSYTITNIPVDNNVNITLDGSNGCTIIRGVQGRTSGECFTGCPTPPHPDFNALMDFYNATNGDSWTNRNGWIEALAGTSCDPCADGWFGVDCKGTNRVLELIMPNNNLSGQLPSTINDFTVLTNITLQNNSIGGSIPDALTLMTTLRTITLDDNNFTGSIPSNIGNLDDCTDFNIAGNNISGPIPASYGDMASLRSSSMRDNQLSGELPAEMANLSNLDAINIRNNQFTGCFPPGFAVFCSQLSFYDFSANTGLNPNNGDFAQFCADPSIDYCAVDPCAGVTINPPLGGDQSYCTADGVPPLTVSIDPGLNARWYDAPSGGNELACCSTSYTPGGAGTYYVEAYDGNGCTSSRTAITLTLNPDPTYFNEVLSCEDANFYQVAFDTDASTITPDVGNLSGCCGSYTITNIPVDNNVNITLEGSNGCTIIRGVQGRTSGECFTGCPTPPHPDFNALLDFYNATNGDSWTNNSGWAGGVAGTSCDPCQDGWLGISCSGGRVSNINLVNNGLSGSLPSTLGNISQLSELNLDDNSIGGSLPSSLTSLSNLTDFQIDDNFITGVIPSDIGNLTNLVFFDVGFNNMSGSIPSSVGNLTSLTDFDVEGNDFSGDLPSSFWNMTSMQSCALRSNRFTGTIPESIANMSNLFAIGFGNNNFSGPLPAAIGNLGITWLYAENCDFSGCFPASYANLCGNGDFNFSGKPQP